MALKKIIISGGDPFGIGPEVCVKALKAIYLSNAYESVAIILCGPIDSFPDIENLDYRCISILEIEQISEHGLYVVNTTEKEHQNKFDSNRIGSCCEIGGYYAKKAIDLAINACNEGYTHAMVTAPISKEAMQLVNKEILGHTEYLAHRTNTKHVVMALVKDKLRVALQSIHIPISEVPSYLTQSLLSRNINIIEKALIEQFKISKPRIALLGLNPHAGENGHIGTEELAVITPFIDSFESKYSQLFGPFAADGFFGSGIYKEYDCILAMYHDQGLVAFKTIAFGGGVNTTLGLPFVRTSPDHGTAYGIAGKNKANSQSMLEAINLAISLVKLKNA